MGKRQSDPKEQSEQTVNRSKTEPFPSLEPFWSQIAELFEKARTDLEIKAAKYKAQDLFRAWRVKVPPQALASFRSLWEAQVEKRETLARVRVADSKKSKPAKHSRDFHSVLWFGQPHTFTHEQAAIVKMLWKAWESETPDIGQACLVEKSGSHSQGRLRDIFKGKGGMHPAWGHMIVESRRGVFRLQPPPEKI